jgi:hypothetical protein
MTNVHPTVAARITAWRGNPSPDVLPEINVPLGTYLNLHRKVGFAQGAFTAILEAWNIPDDLRVIVRECLERLEEPE